MPDALAIGGTPLKAKDLHSVSINTADHPVFVESPKHSYLPIPLIGRALVVDVGNCDYYLLPYIIKKENSINNREPVDAAGAINIFKLL
eukprot:15351177-Ditylum_brightwellii.AAC.1